MMNRIAISLLTIGLATVACGDDGTATGNGANENGGNGNGGGGPCNLVANAGADVSVRTGESVILQGSTSGASGTPALQWLLEEPAPGGSSLEVGDVLGASTQLTFTPDVAGSYRLRLSASEGDCEAFDSVDVTAEAASGCIVEAIASASGDATVGQAFTVNGDGSFIGAQCVGAQLDWTVIDAPAGSTLMGATVEGPNVELTADRPGTYVLELVVSTNTTADSTTIEITATAAPVEGAYGPCDFSCGELCIFAPDPNVPDAGAACAPTCGAGCPAPSDGNAVPSCGINGTHCALTCDNGETCPTGMVCEITQFPTLSQICVWPAP